MNDENNEILIKVCCDVFENLSFMFGETIDLDDAESDSDEFILATMAFKGDKAGSVELVVPSETADILAYNILGIDEDEDLPPGSALDALRELLNTICGQLMTTLFGDQPIFDLTVPETKTITLEEWDRLVESEQYLAISVEDEPILIKANIE